MKGRIKMTRKNYALIPVLAAIALIPQLLFWWLAPAAAAARLTVYIGGTLLTVGIPAVYLATYWNSNLRKTAGLLAVCGVLEIAVTALAALLLGMHVSVRSAVFALVITALACSIVLIPAVSSVLRQQRQGVYSAAIPVEPGTQPMRDTSDRSLHVPGTQTQNPIPSRAPRQAPSGKPLPPRNR